jgi:hypothetical protein
MKKSFKSLAVLTLLVGASQFHQAHAAGVSGAIFTTVANGTVVNANQYASKCDVYLNGGPGPNAKAGAAGLPDGDYYFQVTDPNGKTLLSTDPVINRSFHVTGGVITAYTGITGPTHATNTDQAHAGAITISVANSSCPTDFQDSPNSGGVYKVWPLRPTATSGIRLKSITRIAETDAFMDLLHPRRRPTISRCCRAFQTSA